MERCYVCNSCGKCAEEEELLVPLCRDCGHEVQPGEPTDRCAACGSENIAFPSVGPGAPRR